MVPNSVFFMFTCIHYSFPTFINLFEAPQVRCTLVKFKIATAKLPLFFFGSKIVKNTITKNAVFFMFSCIHYSFPTFINLFEAPQVRCTLVKFKIATAKLPLFFFGSKIVKNTIMKNLMVPN